MQGMISLNCWLRGKTAVHEPFCFILREKISLHHLQVECPGNFVSGQCSHETPLKAHTPLGDFLHQGRARTPWLPRKSVLSPTTEQRSAPRVVIGRLRTLASISLTLSTTFFAWTKAHI